MRAAAIISRHRQRGANLGAHGPHRRLQYLRSRDGIDLFSFDLSDDIFKLYAREGFIPAHRALDLKQAFMSVLQAVEFVHGQFRVVRFELDQDWIEGIRRRMDQ